MSDRAEHLQWCKDRARQEYVYYREKEPASAIRNAVASMLSDLSKHPDTQSALRFAGLLALTVRTEQDLVKFIDGFN